VKKWLKTQIRLLKLAVSRKAEVVDYTGTILWIDKEKGAHEWMIEFKDNH
jgi:hypothetical protein